MRNDGVLVECVDELLHRWRVGRAGEQIGVVDRHHAVRTDGERHSKVFQHFLQHVRPCLFLVGKPAVEIDEKIARQIVHIGAVVVKAHVAVPKHPVGVAEVEDVIEFLEARSGRR